LASSHYPPFDGHLDIVKVTFEHTALSATSQPLKIRFEMAPQNHPSILFDLI